MLCTSRATSHCSLQDWLGLINDILRQAWQRVNSLRKYLPTVLNLNFSALILPFIHITVIQSAGWFISDDFVLFYFWPIQLSMS